MRDSVPQGSVLGNPLFLIYIFSLPDEARYYLNLFAGDAKIRKEVQSNRNSKVLQTPRNIQQWTDKLLVRFIPEKCNIMNIGSDQTDRAVSTVFEEQITRVVLLKEPMS